jgi:hypothetical protein
VAIQLQRRCLARPTHSVLQPTHFRSSIMFRLHFSPQLLVAAGLLCAATGAYAANEVRAYAGVVAGQVRIGPAPGFACATSGPTIGNGWSAGLRLPSEGIAACGLVGGTDDKVGAAGPLSSSFATSGPMAGSGTYSGTAQAQADYWKLGVATTGGATGGASTFIYRQAATFSYFSIDLTYNHPSIVIGTPGTTDFAFFVQGLMNSGSVAPYGQQEDVKLHMRVGGVGNWGAFGVRLDNNALPFITGGSTGLPGSFVSGPGSLAGSATITSTANFNMQWGVPFTLEVALIGDGSPCCFGSTQSLDFLNNGATLAGIVATGPGGAAVNDFSVFTTAGPAVGPGGILPVPEPSTWWLMACGMAGVAGAAARRRALAATAMLLAAGLSACSDSTDDTHLVAPSQVSPVSAVNASSHDSGHAQGSNMRPVFGEAELEELLMRSGRTAPSQVEPVVTDDAPLAVHVDACGCGGGASDRQ